MAAAFAVSVGLTWIVRTAGQADRVRTESSARPPTERLEALKRESERLAADKRSLLGDIRRLEVERQLRAEEVKRVDAEESRLQSDLQLTTGRIAGLEQTEQAQRPELRARMIEVYKLGRARYLRLLFATADIRRVGQAVRTVAAMAAMDRQRVAAHARTLEELSAERLALEDRVRRLTSLRADAMKAQQAAIRAAQVRDELVHDIDRKRELNAQLTSELQASQQRLQLALREMPAAGAPGDVAPLPLTAFRGELSWPTPGVLRRSFSPTGQARANGIEIETLTGLAVMSVHDGTVAFAGPFSGFGNLVIVEHAPQTFSLYGDMLQVAVKKGDRVDRGQRLGSVGPNPSGMSGLYFELRIDGQPVDPLQWLKKR